MAARTGALAGVNGGYFVIGAADGTPGDLAGSSILDGQLVSEAVDGRTDLLLRHDAAAVAALSDSQSVRAADPRGWTSRRRPTSWTPSGRATPSTWTGADRRR